MIREELEARIQSLLSLYLDLEDNGEMMMPMKTHDIGSLHDAIRDLVETAVREATR